MLEAYLNTKELSNLNLLLDNRLHTYIYKIQAQTITVHWVSAKIDAQSSAARRVKVSRDVVIERFKNSGGQPGIRTSPKNRTCNKQSVTARQNLAGGHQSW